MWSGFTRGDPDGLGLPNSDCSLTKPGQYTTTLDKLRQGFHVRVPDQLRARVWTEYGACSGDHPRTRMRLDYGDARMLQPSSIATSQRLRSFLSSLCSHRVNELLCHRSGPPCLQLVTCGWPSSQFYRFLRGFTLTKMRCNQPRCALNIKPKAMRLLSPSTG